MIESMKKYTFLVYHRHYQAFLEQLRETGVLHVRHREGVNLSENPELTAQLEESKRLSALMAALKPLIGQDEPMSPADPEADGPTLMEKIEALRNEKAEKQLAEVNLQKEYDAAAVWGYFDFARMEALRQNGCTVGFWSCPASAFREEWAELYHAVKVSEAGGVQYFVTVTLASSADASAPDAIPADRVRQPLVELTELEDRREQLAKNLAELDERLHYAAVNHYRTLELTACRLRDRYALDAAICDTQKAADDRLMVLEGFVPESAEASLLAFLETADAYYRSAPGDAATDDVPIKLRNGRFAKLYEPLTKLYSLPSYAELDPTACFAPFFTLFFGLCLGDGGYGLLVFLAATFAKRKFPSLKGFAVMGQWMGLATILVGVLTGMVFGISLDSVAWPWLADVKHLFITSNNYQPLGYDPMMVFAIGIGIFQILFAMGFKVVRITHQQGFKYALSDLGWLVLLVDLIVLLILSFSEAGLPEALRYGLLGLAGVCAVFIFFFNSPGKNPLLQFGSGLWGTYNMVSGLLGDVLSYIRLFALGLAGGILGSVFNSLAFQAGGALPGWIGWLPTMIILIFGHGLNFFLCIISSVVHPLRLTYVEFFKNCGYEGGGRAYDPLRKTADA